MRRMLHVCRAILRLARPYLGSEDRRAAWALLLGIVALTLVGAGLGLLVSYSQRLFYTALQERKAEAFLRALFWITPRPHAIAVPPFILFVTLQIACACLSVYLQAVLQLRWQRWLTARLVGDWLADHAYHALSLLRHDRDPGADNPDQRIQEDIEDATRNVIALATGFLSSVSAIASFGGLLWALSGPMRIFGLPIPGYLLWLAIGYAALCTAIAHLVGRGIARINFVRQRFRGDFRISLVGVRENAEEIAFLRGETAEAARVASSFANYYRTALRLVLRTSGLVFVSNMSSEMGIVIPTVIAAPRFFSGAISFGVLNQIRLGFLQLSEAALWFVAAYAQLAEFVSQIERLATFEATLARLRSEARRRARPPAREDRAILAAPARLAGRHGPTIEIRQGRDTAITGPSGSGKTTMLRALAGIGTGSSGHARIPAARVVFVPQRAWLHDGELGRALCYPDDPTRHAASEQRRVLAAVGLPELASRLELSDAWQRLLSPGQLQRLAVARAILQRPVWLFLDEPGSALEATARLALHRTLKRELPAATIVTVTHDREVAGLHAEQIALDGAGEDRE